MAGLGFGFGEGKSRPIFSFDPAAQAYFTAAGITDPTQKTAYNNHVVRGRASGWYATLIAEYPFIGGNASAHSINAINPALYQITWVNAPTQNANGVTANGSTSYGNTNNLYTAIPHLCGFTIYARTNPTLNSNNTWIGYQGAANVPYYVMDRLDLGAGATYNRGGLGDVSLMAFEGPGAATRIRVIAVNRTSTTSLNIYNDGISFGSNVGSDTGVAPTGSLFIFASDAVGSPFGFSGANFAHAAFHTGHSGAQALAYALSLQQLETDLGRNV